MESVHLLSSLSHPAFTSLPPHLPLTGRPPLLCRRPLPTRTLLQTSPCTASLIRNPFKRPPQKQDILDLPALIAAGVPAIRVLGLQKAFKARARRGTKEDRARSIVAVDGVSFDVMPGEIFGLLGPNSCGKTTTMRCVSTLSKPDSGSTSVFGVDCDKEPYVVRSMMSYVAQNAGLDKVLTGREHLELFGALAHLEKDEIKHNIDQLVDLLDLADFIDRQTKVYSGGVARRLDMAIALMQRPAVLVLDEPTVGLDQSSRATIWRILRQLRDNGAAILLTSHYLEEVEVLADSVAIMEKGVVIASGKVGELKQQLGGDRLTVRIDEFTGRDVAERAAAHLRELQGVKTVLVNRLRGNCLEIVVDKDDSRASSKIVDHLATIGHGNLFGFSQSRPSLDDVYMAATGKRLEDADLEAKSVRDEKAQRKESMM